MKNEDYINNIPDAERRFFGSEVRLHEDGGDQFFTGAGIVFDTVTDIGPFTEEISSRAADNVLEQDVRGAFNHSSDIILGRTTSGTMQLIKTDRGIDYKIKYNPNDPDHVRVREKIKRGDVTGSSFAFGVKKDEWSKRDNKPHRKVMELSLLLDIGPVTYPAYNETTAAMRSLDKSIKESEPEVLNTQYYRLRGKRTEKLLQQINKQK